MFDAQLNPPPVFPPTSPLSPPVLPQCWEATAVLHPFSPLQPGGNPGDPFFELCIANIYYQENQAFSVQLLGSSGRTWWYWIDQANVTHLSTDQGGNWTTVTTGWELPSTSWIASAGRCFASGPLNWITEAAGQSVDWWTQPAGPKAATWMWFDSVAGVPVRMMFGAPPPSFNTGAPGELAVLQNFSFTYFPTFTPRSPGQISWSTPSIPTVQFGNAGLQLFEWSTNFGMTVMMTPVDSASNPMPTQVMYHWAVDGYQNLPDRAQQTAMNNEYNGGPAWVVALMFGAAPSGLRDPSPLAGNSLLYTVNSNGNVTSCAPLTGPGGMRLAAEPPDWVKIPGVQGTIQAVVTNDSVLSPNEQVAIVSVLFPPSDEYPAYSESRYLWTWYSPLSPDGSSARPVTFMESASTISVGTSLALADYSDYQIFPTPIDPGHFTVPTQCPIPAPQLRLPHRKG